MKHSHSGALGLFIALSLGCDKQPEPVQAIHDLPAPQPPAPAAPAPAAVDIHTVIQALPPVGLQDANKVTLGRRLFHERRLSGDNTISCASCHAIDHGGVDGLVVSTGIHGQRGGINAPTVLNARFNFVQFWDGRAADLAAQAAGPVANPAEMGNTWPNVENTLRRDPTYVQAFARSYPDGITAANVQNAIATYENTLVTPSRFDRWLTGDNTALNEQEAAGARLFAQVGCTNCHNGNNIGGGTYQKMGAVRDYFTARGHLTDADNGRFNVTHQESDRHFFKVPTLRNIALTAPYFHDGTATTLEQAIRTMGSVQLGRDLDDAQVASLATFLRSLTGEVPPEALMPATAPTGAAPAAAAPRPAAAAAAHP